jgi:sulfatase maturation enzyme AslB (radical SAM superfamily)
MLLLKLGEKSYNHFVSIKAWHWFSYGIGSTRYSYHHVWMSCMCKWFSLHYNEWNSYYNTNNNNIEGSLQAWNFLWNFFAWCQCSWWHNYVFKIVYANVASQGKLASNHLCQFELMFFLYIFSFMNWMPLSTKVAFQISMG